MAEVSYSKDIKAESKDKNDISKGLKYLTNWSAKYNDLKRSSFGMAMNNFGLNCTYQCIYE